MVAAAELVNRLSPGSECGRRLELPPDERSRCELAAGVEATLTGRRGRLSPEAAEGLIFLADELRQVFAAAAERDPERAAGLVNRLLHRYQAAPQLARHDGEPWHLHFHSQGREAGRAVARGAMCATALAVVLGSPGAARLGVCRSSGCDRVYVDGSRNGSRRFCSAGCMNRSKVAAFRARRAQASAAEDARQTRPPRSGRRPPA
ncbi:MAG: CGNR zinc finger domain-containing protein [Candidatus Dormibacteria bacterium]